MSDPTTDQHIKRALQRGPISLRDYISNADDDFREILGLVDKMNDKDRVIDPDLVMNDIEALQAALREKIDKWT